MNCPKLSNLHSHYLLPAESCIWQFATNTCAVCITVQQDLCLSLCSSYFKSVLAQNIFLSAIKPEAKKYRCTQVVSAGTSKLMLQKECNQKITGAENV